MSLKVIDKTNNFPIKTETAVHSGKVRSVYWLTKQDSKRLIEQHDYNVSLDSELGVMIISDKISAFDCVWQGENNLRGIPGKGAVLNAISSFWFNQFAANGFANNHIVDTPHPLVWIVQKVQPLKIEAIARQYITGSMWRNYQQGERLISGIQLPDNLQKNQKLNKLLITPTTKGIINDINGVSATEDANISRKIIEDNYQKFNFYCLEDITKYEHLLTLGFNFISNKLADIGQTFVDTKFEFGYANDANDNRHLIYIDEIGTPDSSRMWNTHEYNNGNIIEQSKEFFRQKLLNLVADADILLNANKMQQRIKLAQDTLIPQAIFLEVSEQYLNIAKQITRENISIPEAPEEEITAILNEYQLLNYKGNN
jgi:phosphoribosylaminoimidazole-succinocarboxamide synthase